MTGLRQSAPSVVVGVALLVFGGCGAAPKPAPVTAAPTPTVERYGAPVITDPRDVSTVFGSPCTQLLTQEDLRTLRIVEEGRPRSYLGSNQCSWTTRDDDLLSLAVDNDRDLLVDTYRARLTPIFIPTTVEGLPAVREKTSDAYNACTVTVGLGPRQAIEADWNGLAPAARAPDPCAQAERALSLAIRKLPPQK
ncbi:MAG: hypothetical protein QOE59_5062 [Actinomycetota bacterium]|nr:hypothetical protein [Actinomycetota bacterium]